MSESLEILGGGRVDGRLEESRDVLFPVPRCGDLAESGLAGVHEDEDVPAARVGTGGRDVLREWIVVKLLVDDDPHADAVATHHRKEHLVPLLEPLVANVDLLGPGQQFHLLGVSGVAGLGGAGAAQQRQGGKQQGE